MCSSVLSQKSFELGCHSEPEAKKGLDEKAALEVGMKEKAEELRKSGAKIYHEVPAEGTSADRPPGSGRRPKTSRIACAVKQSTALDKGPTWGQILKEVNESADGPFSTACRDEGVTT